LQTHKGGNTWKVIEENLEELYDVKTDIISPHNFGIPQHRNRFYIVGRLKSKGGLKNFSFPEHSDDKPCDIKTIICEEDSDYMSLRNQTRAHLNAWSNFLKILTDNNIEIPSFPIWAMEWGATYEYENTPPCRQQRRTLEGKRGKFGKVMHGHSKDDLLLQLPIYAQSDKLDDNKQFPEWKKIISAGIANSTKKTKKYWTNGCQKSNRLVLKTVIKNLSGIVVPARM